MERSRNLAARAGRWSATHRRIAIAGWFAFVILALLLGSAIGVEEIKDEDSGVGEAREADRAVAEAFPDNPGETVLVQSRSGVTADQPEFRAVVDDAVSSSSRPRTSSTSKAPTPPAPRAGSRRTARRR